MTVLVCYLPNPIGDAAFDAGLAEAVRRGDPIVLVNSPHGGQLVDPDVADDDRVARLTAAAQGAGVPLSWRHDEHREDVAQLVIDVAEEVDASVVVIGLRRRSAVGKLLMGSVAQRILLGSDRQVLAVKAAG